MSFKVSQHYGGVGYNLALSAARNCPERKPVFLTCVGEDSHADNLERNIEIDIELIRVQDAVTGQYTCIVNNTGEISLAIQVKFETGSNFISILGYESIVRFPAVQIPQGRIL